MMAVMLLGACSSVRPVEVQAVPLAVDRPALPRLPLPPPISTQPVDWLVLTPDRLPPGDWAAMCVSPGGYETLSLNQADTLRWVTEAFHQLRYYRQEQANAPHP